jgi:hypothetical protein
MESFTSDQLVNFAITYLLDDEVLPVDLNGELIRRGIDTEFLKRKYAV